MSVLPYSFIPEIDNDRQVTIKRKNGLVANPYGPQYVYFMDERDAPVGVNYGFDRDLNLFRCERIGIEQNAISTIQRQMEQRNKLEIKELKAKHKADIAAKAPLSKATLKWLVKTIKKAVKHEDIIVDCCNKESEIELRCRKNHESWPSDLTATRYKRRKSEDELMYILNAIKSELPQLEEKLGVK